MCCAFPDLSAPRSLGGKFEIASLTAPSIDIEALPSKKRSEARKKLALHASMFADLAARLATARQNCGAVHDRDVNGAQNILLTGLASRMEKEYATVSKTIDKYTVHLKRHISKVVSGTVLLTHARESRPRKSVRAQHLRRER